MSEQVHGYPVQGAEEGARRARVTWQGGGGGVQSCLLIGNVASHCANSSQDSCCLCSLHMKSNGHVGLHPYTYINKYI